MQKLWGFRSFLLCRSIIIPSFLCRDDSETNKTPKTSSSFMHAHMYTHHRKSMFTKWKLCTCTRHIEWFRGGGGGGGINAINNLLKSLLWNIKSYPIYTDINAKDVKILLNRSLHKFYFVFIDKPRSNLVLRRNCFRLGYLKKDWAYFIWKKIQWHTNLMKQKGRHTTAQSHSSSNIRPLLVNTLVIVCCPHVLKTCENCHIKTNYLLLWNFNMFKVSCNNI